MGGSSMTGSTTTQNQLPKWYEQAAEDQIDLANRTAQIGHVPYFGPDVAAFQPQQLNAMQSGSDWLTGFGMAPQTDVRAGIPAPQQFAGGIQGYSSAPLHTQSLAALRTNMPGIYNYLRQFQVDPLTGKTVKPSDVSGDGKKDRKKRRRNRRNGGGGGSGGGGGGGGSGSGD